MENLAIKVPFTGIGIKCFFRGSLVINISPSQPLRLMTEKDSCEVFLLMCDVFILFWIDLRDPNPLQLSGRTFGAVSFVS